MTEAPRPVRVRFAPSPTGMFHVGPDAAERLG
ncbi:glutamate--tRNA ligase family protein [Kitasatospora xanthocidica]|nr:glutamate--tRNA ligase family protein [Kitasatospora xanthocidica]